MSLLRIKKTESGFTLLEITIVMALVGILTVATLAGSGNATKNAAFIGDIRIIRANIRDSETKSYTVKTGNGCATTESGPGGGASVCYWRGNVMTFAVGGPDTSYSMNLLYGSDLSAATGFTNPRNGLYGMTSPATSTFNLGHLKIDSINVGGSVAANGIVSGGSTVSSVSLAFLAPDGRTYSCDTVHNGAGCVPSKLSNPTPYADSGDINISLSDASSSHTAVVTIRPSDGTISSINL